MEKSVDLNTNIDNLIKKAALSPENQRYKISPNVFAFPNLQKRFS